MTETAASPRRVTAWPADAVKRFWRYWETRAHLQGEYFSRQVAPGILRLLRGAGLLHGTVLDYGCGPGYLVERYLQEPVRVRAVEFSPHAVELVNRKFQGRSNWQGCAHLSDDPGVLPVGQCDVVSCIEVIEHLDDAMLARTLANIRACLKPEGVALLTTPFAEDLDAGMVYCPFCDCEFHQIQHVRRFDVASLRQTLSANGLRPLWCRNIDLLDLTRMNLATGKGWHPGRLWRARLRGLKPGRHLCAIVARDEAAPVSPA